MTAALALEPRRASLVAASFARDPDDLRLLLDALGLLPEPGAPQGFPRPRVVPAHTRHTRATYVPGCPNCRARNRAYMQQWRARRPVTRRVLIVVVTVPTGRGRHRAWPGQLAIGVPA